MRPRSAPDIDSLVADFVSRHSKNLSQYCLKILELKEQYDNQPLIRGHINAHCYFLGKLANSVELKKLLLDKNTQDLDRAIAYLEDANNSSGIYHIPEYAFQMKAAKRDVEKLRYTFIGTSVGSP